MKKTNDDSQILYCNRCSIGLIWKICQHSIRVLQWSFWNRLLRHFFTNHARQELYFIICHSAIFLLSIESLNPSVCQTYMTPAVNREPCYSERWNVLTPCLWFSRWSCDMSHCFGVDPKDQLTKSCWCFRSPKPKDTKVSQGEWLAFLWKLGSFPKTSVTLAIRTCRGVIEL